MRGWALRVALIGLLLSSPAALAGDPVGGKKPADLRKDDEALKKQVNEAIDRGVAWLLSRQAPDGSFRWDFEDLVPGAPLPENLVKAMAAQRWGETALALYTLRACGVARNSPAVVSGFGWLREQYLARKDKEPGLDTYCCSLALMALEAQRNAAETAAPPPKKGGKEPPRVAPAPAPDADREWMRDLAARLVGAQARSGGFGYQSSAVNYAEAAPPAPTYEDHSNTQFALLALKAARRCGVDLPQDVWLRALRHLLESQEKDGPGVARGTPPPRPGAPKESVSTVKDRARGWGYHDRDPATGSMTTGGVSGLAICRSELLGLPEYDAALDGRAEQGIWDGIAWLGLGFTVAENPGPAKAPMGREQWQYYYLYGLERSGVLADTAMMGPHDWYREGAAYLVRMQADGGAWSQEPGSRFLPPRGPDTPPNPGRNPTPPPPVPPPNLRANRIGNLLDTCFALLFLKRATFRVATVGAADTLELSGAAALDDAAFRDLFEAVFRRFAAGIGPTRDERAADFVKMGTRSIPLLVMKLEDDAAEARGAAIAALERTTGLSQGFDPAAPDAARAAAVKAWQEWWFAKKATLVADADAGRFRE
jgi:hypothetical protein